MAGEHSPVQEEVVGVEAAVPRPKVCATDSSSKNDTSDQSGGESGDGDEASRAVNQRESERSYDFGASIIIVGRIRQLEALGYFPEGSACEPGEEVIPKPADNKAVVFEEFFAAGLQRLPQPVLTDILVNYKVQIHQLTPNAFAQRSKYFWAVMSFNGKPSSDGFANRYELHYQPKKVY
jgi:hypothetical protein